MPLNWDHAQCCRYPHGASAVRRSAYVRGVADALAERFKPAENSHDALVDLVLEFVARVRAAADGLETGEDIVQLRAKRCAHPQPHPKVSLALQEIARQCIDSGLRLGDISTCVGLSPAYLDKLLKRGTALGFSDHLRRARLALAERRLVRDNEPIKAVALSVGFSHVSSFNRAFLRVHGCSPSQWKVRNVAGQNHSGR
jgi:AraC-like DNA-binding protein